VRIEGSHEAPILTAKYEVAVIPDESNIPEGFEYGATFGNAGIAFHVYMRAKA
jgi:hypothetical protein